jgi:hypothetical protein
MITNSDIYIHHFNISLLYNLNPKLIYSLTRFEHDMSYLMILFKFGSHDTFIFKNNINYDFVKYLDYYQNVWGSELTTMFYIHKNNIEILNPPYQLQTIHLHKSELRNNNRKILPINNYYFSTQIIIYSVYDNIKLINLKLNNLIKNSTNYKLNDCFNIFLLFNYVLPKTKKNHFFSNVSNNQNSHIGIHNFNTAKFSSKTISSQFNIIVSNSNNSDYNNYSYKFKNLLNPNIHSVFSDNINNLFLHPNSISIPLNYIYISNFHKYINNFPLTNNKSNFCLCLNYNLPDVSNNNIHNLINSLHSYKNITFINDKSFEAIYNINSYIHYLNSFKFIIFFDNSNSINYLSNILISQSIPICFNHSSISQFFNPNSILFIPPDLSTHNINILLNKIINIDNDTSLYNSFFNLTHPTNNLPNYQETLANLFYSIIS